jgi:hypothetical protein
MMTPARLGRRGDMVANCIRTAEVALREMVALVSAPVGRQFVRSPSAADPAEPHCRRHGHHRLLHLNGRSLFTSPVVYRMRSRPSGRADHFSCLGQVHPLAVAVEITLGTELLGISAAEGQTKSVM